MSYQVLLDCSQGNALSLDLDDTVDPAEKPETAIVGKFRAVGQFEPGELAKIRAAYI